MTPVISRFYGIIIRMYFQQAEHNPPHIHALYGDDMVAIWFKDGNILEGELPTKELALVREWVNLNQTELLMMWETQAFKKLEPLQ